MDLKQAVNILNNQLKVKQPKKFSSTWVLTNAPQVYRFVRLNLRTENNQLDWDRLTYRLNKPFQKRWIYYQRKTVKRYEDQAEIDLIIDHHQSKLYVLIAPITNADKRRREQIIISLVRMAQRGNILAKQELYHWLAYVIDDWIDKYQSLSRWRGYNDQIRSNVDRCIRRYRYSGCFLGYLYRTLEYAGRGLYPLQKFSFDDPILDGQKTRIDYFIQ